MIKAKGYMPYVLWVSEAVDIFEKKVHRNIANDILDGILEDAVHSVPEASVTYIASGGFRVIAHNEDADLELACEILTGIISEYELSEYYED